MIDGLADEAGFEVVARIDQGDDIALATTAQVCIEFSTPHAAPLNIKRLIELGVPTVVGTTGWLSHLSEVETQVIATNGALVWSANYSIGVNIFAKIVEEAAKRFEGHPEYGAWAYEIHHKAKLDAPSGTLKMLVQSMRDGGYSHPVDESSTRAGFVPGTHDIAFDGPADTIELRHTARSREGFARGALTAARWIVGKKGLHEFKDVLWNES